MAFPLWLVSLVACVLPDPAVAPRPASEARAADSVVQIRARAAGDLDSGEPDYSIGAAHPRAGRR